MYLLIQNQKVIAEFVDIKKCLDIKIKFSRHIEAFSSLFSISMHEKVKKPDKTLIPVLRWEFELWKNFLKSIWGRRQTLEWGHEWLLQLFVGRFLIFLWSIISPPCGKLPFSFAFPFGCVWWVRTTSKGSQMVFSNWRDMSSLSPCNSPQVHMTSFYYLQILLITLALTFTWNIIFSAWDSMRLQEERYLLICYDKIFFLI